MAYQVVVTVTDTQIQTIIDVLNRHEIDTDDGEQYLTLEEVNNNPELLKYLCEEAVKDGTALFDPEEYWNCDGWCDFKQYR